jgi:MerR family transcriptional regulator, copper efflux regulator
VGMDGLTISQLARGAGVHLETLRYYERRGLLPRPPRSRSGYRQYPPDAVRRVRFIKRAQGLGFTLEEIEDLLALRVQQHGRGCGAVEQEARGVMARVEGRIAELERLRTVLVKLVTACHGRRATEECPIMHVLDDAEGQPQ